MSSERYRIVLVSEPSRALTLSPGYEAPQPEREWKSPLQALLAALEQVARRGPGPAAWASVTDDPLTFLLDGMSDALVVRDPHGQVIFANAEARALRLLERAFLQFEEFERDGHLLRARGLRFRGPDGQLSFSLFSRVRR